jgi:hypothetical protein
MRRRHLNNTTFFAFPKGIILKRDNNRAIFQKWRGPSLKHFVDKYMCPKRPTET